MVRHHRPSPLGRLALVWTCCWCCMLLLRHNGGGVTAQTSNGDDDVVTGSNDDATANTACDASSTEMIGDALCDFDLNVAACGFDGGDCCECTCIDTDEQACGEGGAGYFCLDPDALQDCGPTGSPAPSPSSLGTSSSSSSDMSTTYPGCGGYLPHMGDGFCDEDLNNAACGFDGGDCCVCTCGAGASAGSDSPEHACGQVGDGYDCRDPDVPADCGATPSPAASFGYPDCTGYLYDWQDSYCDSDLNNEECGWDGGDCCRCTCREYSSWSTTCGYYGFDCMDPEAPSTCSTESPTPSPAAGTDYPECEGTIFSIGDGFCQSFNNNEECNWDGGDCCPCTCEDSSWYYSSCGYYGFDCLDPAVSTDCSPAPTPSPTLSPYPECPGTVSYIGDGDCDSYNNNEDCGWDGGDCCPCTCDDTGSLYTCGDYDCLDPTVSTDCITTSTQYNLGYTYYGSAYCPDSGDGKCDNGFNTEACDWDGGDCCECDCISSSYNCGINGYSCLDPASTCTSSTAFSDDDFGINGDDYTDRDFGDSSTVAIPADLQEAWAGDTSESSYTTVAIIRIMAVLVMGFCIFGMCIFAACGLARRRYFEDKVDSATQGETTRAYSMQPLGRPARPSGAPLAASVASASAIPPESTDQTNNSIKRSRSLRHSSQRGVHPGLEDREREEKVEIDPAFFGGGRVGRGVAEVNREDRGESDSDGGRGDAAGGYGGVSDGADAANAGGEEGDGGVSEGGDIAADAHPAQDADAAGSPAVVVDADPPGGANDGAPKDDNPPARDIVATGAGAAGAVDEEVVAAASDGGAGEAVVASPGNEEESAGESAEKISNNSTQPIEEVAVVGGYAGEERPPGGDTAVDDGDTTTPVVVADSS